MPEPNDRLPFWIEAPQFPKGFDFSAAPRAGVINALRFAARMDFWALTEAEETALRGLLRRAVELLLEKRRAALADAMAEIGWAEIEAFEAALKRGQDVREDAGGFFARALRRLFGLPPPPDPLMTYRDAARALVDEITRNDGADAPGGPFDPDATNAMR
jgi:hypothetical protein